jgi:asparagine synthase (glutamine-hydrolysing)
MCGFIFRTNLGNSRGKKLEDFSSITQDLSHRGPDENILMKNSSDEMNFYRLAIRDLQGGKQPFFISKDVTSMINGELYNEDEVREALNEKGFRKLPTGDMNLMAFFLDSLGIQNIDKLDGMFAGVIHDKKNAKVLLFRDKIGEKPLFFHLSSRSLYVSSEMFWTKEFQPKPEIGDSPRSQIDSLLNGIWANENQFRNEMQSLPPGSYAIVDLNSGSITSTKYWSWPKRERAKSSNSELSPDYLERLDSEIRRAVSSRLVSDYPIATLLSGGIDSGLITAIANEFGNGNSTAFTLDFKDSSYSEVAAARLTANFIGVKHEVVTLKNKDLAVLVQETIAAMDVPIIDSGALSLFAITKYLGKEFKVALSGDGGDELFMGYGMFSYFKTINHALTHQPISKIGIRALIAITSLNKNSYLSLNMKLQRMESLLHNSSLPPIHVALSPFAGTPIFQHLAKSLPRGGVVKITSEEIEQYYREEILPKLYLVKSDRMSMRHGVELRSPFFSPRLINIANELSCDSLIKKELKLPLRKVARNYLPREVFELPKHGFSSPFAEIRHYVQEPKWNLESLGIPSSLASKVWNTKDENSGIASWALIVLHDFNKR